MPVKVLYLLILAYVTFFFYKRQGGLWTLNRFYLPVMLFVPFLFVVIITPILPAFGFYSTGLITLYFAGLYHEKRPFTFTLPDYIVLLLWGFTTASAIFSTDIKYGIFVLQESAIHMVMPYFIIRHMVPKEKLLGLFISFTVFTTVIALLAPLEFIANIRFPQILQTIWPGNVMPITFRRGGGYRVFSSFGHPIHAGMIFSLALMLAFSLYRTPFFTQKKKFLYAIMINGLAIYMTVSRTSYILVPPLLLLINMNFIKKKLSYFLVLALGVVLSLSVALPAMESISQAGSQLNADETASSVAYRSILMDNYYKEIQKKPIWGYGLNPPVVDGQWSIDNHYLLMMISTGIPSLVIFAALMIVVFLKGLHGYFFKVNAQEKNLLWLLLVFLIYFAIVLGSVWLHNQPRILFYFTLAAIVNLTEVPRFKRQALPNLPRVL